MLAEEFGGGRSPAPTRHKRPASKRSRSTDRDRGDRPSGYGSLDIDLDRLQKLTPYAVPVETAPAADPGPRPEQGSAGQPQGDGALADSLLANFDPQGARAEDDTVSRLMANFDQPMAGGEADSPEQKLVHARTYQLSWDEYNKLSEEQRAAVDFNTLLIQARQKDLRLQDKYDPSAGQRQEYDQAVEKMFGQDGGSETFAPETLAVLRQVDFHAKDESLDDFLGLDQVVSAKELADFKPEPIERSVRYQDGTALASKAYVGQEQAARNTSRLQQALVKSNQMLQNFRVTSRADRNADVAEFGGRENKVRTTPGFGGPSTVEGLSKDDAQRNQFFQQAFEKLSLSLTPEETGQAWAIIKPALESQGDVAEFLRYADDRSNQALTYDAPLGEGKDFRSPEEFRALLGLDRGDR